MNGISAFNPFSNQYHALDDFKKLTIAQKIVTIALTALASLATAFIGTAFVFRALVGHFVPEVKIKPNDTFFLAQRKSAALAQLLSGKRPAASNAFFKPAVTNSDLGKATAPAVDQPKILSSQEKIELSRQQWTQNASTGSYDANFQLLGSIFSDQSICDQALLQFLKDVQVRPNGGFFLEEGMPTTLVQVLFDERPAVYNVFFKPIVTNSSNGQATASTVASPNTESTISISNLDTGYRDIQCIAKGLTANFPPKIPPVTFSGAEKTNLPDAQDTVSNLEEHLKNTYGNALNNAGWHGRLSFQRILWQDEKFVQAIKDPLVVKLIFSSASDGTEAQLGGGNSISGLMLYGLGSNRLSYLVSAAPNWDNKPGGISWNHLQDMGLIRKDKETPWKVTPEYIKDVKAALDSIRTVFASSGVQAPADKLASVHAQINNASVSELIDAFNTLIDDDTKIRNLTLSAAGASTEPNRMAGQCFEVMASYNDALALNNGDHAAALGYGLVSHALDARHLAAALYVESKKGSYYNQIVGRYGQNSEIFNGASTLKDLLNSASSGKLNAEATNLLKIRLQQAVTLIVDNPKIGPTAQEVSAALTSVKT